MISLDRLWGMYSDFPGRCREIGNSLGSSLGSSLAWMNRSEILLQGIEKEAMGGSVGGGSSG